MTGNYLADVNEEGIFSRSELRSEIEKTRGRLSEANFKRILQKLLDGGELLRVGRNAYSVAAGRKNYVYGYSDISRSLAEYIEKNNPYLEFVIMELVQFNEFMNHQIAQNVYFLYVEGEYGEYLFDPLKNLFPGKVLLYPDVETFHRYCSENVVVIQKLVSQSPRDKRWKWTVRIEKLLVDLFADSILGSIVSYSEYSAIYEDIFEKYAVDESTLLRYAGRRGVKWKILDFIVDETNIRLRTVEHMSEKRLNNTIFLMYLVTENYCRAHHISPREFLKLDDKYAILNYVSECPDIFDSMTDEEMVEEIDEYVS